MVKQYRADLTKYLLSPAIPANAVGVNLNQRLLSYFNLTYFLHSDQANPRARSKTIPPLPKSLKFDIPAAFSTTSSGEKFLFLDHLYANETKRMLAFASPMQLRILFSSELICVDGTFSICPRHHKQLLIIQSIDPLKYDGEELFVYLLVFVSKFILPFDSIEQFFSICF